MAERTKTLREILTQWLLYIVGGNIHIIISINIEYSNGQKIILPHQDRPGHSLIPMGPDLQKCNILLKLKIQISLKPNDCPKRMNFPKFNRPNSRLQLGKPCKPRKSVNFCGFMWIREIKRVAPERILTFCNPWPF